MSEYELRTELTRLHAELSAVDAALGEYYCPVHDPETDEPCGSFYRDHGVHLAMEEIGRLRARLSELELAVHVNEKSLDEYAQTVHSLRAELDRVRRAAQEQSEEVQCNWLSPAETEGLRRQLAAAGKQAQMAGDALDGLRQKRGSGTSTSTR